MRSHTQNALPIPCTQAPRATNALASRSPRGRDAAAGGTPRCTGQEKERRATRAQASAVSRLPICSARMRCRTHTPSSGDAQQPSAAAGGPLAGTSAAVACVCAWVSLRALHSWLLVAALRWCTEYFRQGPAQPWRPVPRGSKECPGGCNAGNCNHDTGLCDCPAGAQCMARSLQLGSSNAWHDHCGRGAVHGMVIPASGKPMQRLADLSISTHMTTKPWVFNSMQCTSLLCRSTPCVLSCTQIRPCIQPPLLHSVN